MVIVENLPQNIRHYSDSGLMLRQIETGAMYEDAVDIVPCPYTYEETDIPIPDAPIDAQAALEILMGGDGT